MRASAARWRMESLLSGGNDTATGSQLASLVSVTCVSSRSFSINAGILVLGVDPDDRLGAREPMQEPAAGPEQQLHAVQVVHARHALAAARGRRVGPQVLDEGAQHRHRQMEVAAAVRERAVGRVLPRRRCASSVPPECAIASRTRSAERTPSRSGRWNATPRPPDSSPPIATSPESIFAAMCLKPTGVTWSGTPRRAATRSRSSDVENVFAMPPRMRPRTVRLSARSARTRCGVTNRPPESRTPSRSPSPSLARTTSKRSAGEGLPRRGEILGNRLGVDAAEERIAVRAERHHGRRVAGADDRLEQRPGRSVDRVEENPHAGPADRVEIDEAGDRVAIRRREVERLDGAARPSGRRAGPRRGRSRRTSRASRCRRTRISPSRRSRAAGCATP